MHELGFGLCVCVRILVLIAQFSGVNDCAAKYFYVTLKILESNLH